ncbi:hypothetical protein INT46_009624 [Mucor plumbeus]|uniref:Uncharacterized protein n=1 Tax=Mucor plumbeus TaxID=97098 RepID=A0A8H7REV3_9FUNG|nr:hypothetical protein INT46_009624 [Mucor plumbeus]
MTDSFDSLYLEKLTDDDLEDVVEEHSEYLKTRSYKITASDVDFRIGNQRARRSLEKSKKETTLGKEVQQIENSISDDKPSKEEAHSQDTNVVITNEDFTSKLYSFCCQYPNHPLQKKSNNTMVKSKSSSLCRNLDCILYKHHQSANARDSLSVLSIAIVGATSVLFNARLYPYTSNPSPPNTGTINLNFILPQ